MTCTEMKVERQHVPKVQLIHPHRAVDYHKGIQPTHGTDEGVADERLKLKRECSVLVSSVDRTKYMGYRGCHCH